MEDDNPVLHGAPAEVDRNNPDPVLPGAPAEVDRNDAVLHPVPASVDGHDHILVGASTAVDANNDALHQVPEVLGVHDQVLDLDPVAVEAGILDPAVLHGEGYSAIVAPVDVDGAFLLLDKTVDAVESSAEKTVSSDSPVATDDAKAKAAGKADAEVVRPLKKPRLFPLELEETEMYWIGKRRLNPGLTRSQDKLPARKLVDQLRKKGDICVEVKGEGEGWYFECTLCKYPTIHDFEITRHLDHKDHKSMLQRFEYSMLPHARKWPFNNGVQFFNSSPELDSDAETRAPVMSIESSQYAVVSQNIGLGRIFKRLQLTNLQREVLCTRSMWCEWLGTENPQIPSEDRYRDYPVAILAFMFLASFLNHCSRMPEMKIKFEICETKIEQGYFCATLVSSMTSTVLCPATNIYIQTDPL